MPTAQHCEIKQRCRALGTHKDMFCGWEGHCYSAASNLMSISEIFCATCSVSTLLL